LTRKNEGKVSPAFQPGGPELPRYRLSQFAFLETEFPTLFENARKAEKAALSDPRGACFWARLTLEIAVKWLYTRDPALRRTYNDNLSALIAEPSFAELAGPQIVTKAHFIRDLGNRAAHDSRKPITGTAAISSVRELFHICYWIARTYATGPKPAPSLQFDAGPTRMIMTRRRRATPSSTCCWPKPAGPSTRPATASSRSRGCRTTSGRASSTTCSGATTASRWRWSRPSGPAATRVGQQQAKLYADCLEAAGSAAPGDLLHQRLRALDLGRQAPTRRARCRAS
jgi:hypothetical protein